MKASAFLSITTKVLLLIVFTLIPNNTYANDKNSTVMKKKILFVVTSHDKKGNTGEATGFYLSEVAHPWNELINAGYEIDFVSPKGGKAPVDGFDLTDPINKRFWENEAYRYKIEHTMTPAEIKPDNYSAIHYAGGHGTMWDFSDNAALASIAAIIYENGGLISAVCHGPAGLINIKLSNGKYLVDGKKINAFTNEEEIAVRLDKVVPFLLESSLIERGVIFEKSAPWQQHVIIDQRVITGQNPQSAKAVGEAVVTQLSQVNEIAVLTRYEVKDGHEKKFRKAIRKYVKRAIAKEDNIMAEAYYEEETTSVLWIIERWNNENGFEQIRQGKKFKLIKLLSKKKLSQPARTIYVKDLEPISKEKWQENPRKEDQPITIMLFVDSKAGTEDKFKTTYHAAMPKFRGEPGVINYQLSQLKDDSTQFVTYEKFRNEDAFQYHLNFPPIQPVIDYLNTSIRQQPSRSGFTV